MVSLLRDAASIWSMAASSVWVYDWIWNSVRVKASMIRLTWSESCWMALSCEIAVLTICWFSLSALSWWVCYAKVEPEENAPPSQAPIPMMVVRRAMPPATARTMRGAPRLWRLRECDLDHHVCTGRAPKGLYRWGCLAVSSWKKGEWYSRGACLCWLSGRRMNVENLLQ